MKIVAFIGIAYLVSIVTCKCGTREVIIGGKIVGGRKASTNEFPWIAALGNIEHEAASQSYFVHFCGASIIHSRWLVTAAHCLYNKNISNIMAMVGATNIEHLTDSATVVTFSKAVIHDGYQHPSFKHDIALLYTSKAIPINSININAICLPIQNESFSGKAYVSGWGRIAEDEETSDDLKVTELKIYDDQVCNYLHLNEFHPSLMFCAGERLKRYDSCKGDSGGPLEKNVDDVAVLAGIVSFGEGCGRDLYLGVYTEVSHYVNWIHEIMSSAKVSIKDIQDEDVCGISPVDVDPLYEERRNAIKLKGINKNKFLAIKNEFPWDVAIQVMDVRSLKFHYLCTGIIINQNWILTAASCINRNSFVLMRGVFGINNLDTEINSAMIIGFKKAIIHKHFQKETRENDIALLQTLRQIRFNLNEKSTSSVVNSICLPKVYRNFTGEVIASGWGSMHTNLFGAWLTTFFMHVSREMKCEKRLENSSIPYDNLSMICATNFNTTFKTCQRFSGSAIQKKIDKKHFLIAIVSQCESSSHKIPGVYMKASHFIDWIIKTITAEENKQLIPRRFKYSKKIQNILKDSGTN